jgi:mycofactocin precursor
VAPIVEQHPDVVEPTEIEAGTAPEQAADAVLAEPPADEVLAEDLLVEEVSIDGMCGVY